MTIPTPFDPLKFLTLAEQLAVNAGVDEAHYRSAVSRAYYALFLLARQRLEATGRFVPSTRGDDHRDVIAVLRSMSQRDGDQLDKLRAERNRADYNLGVYVSQGHAQHAVAIGKALEAGLARTVT